MTVVVFGNISMDLLISAPRAPQIGETITGNASITRPGGRGGNQAVACARFGVPTRIVGRVGDDLFGEALRTGLIDNGVDVSGVATHPGPSGVIAVTLSDAGGSSAIVVAGANAAIDNEDLARLEAALDGAKMLLLQLGLPMETVTAAAQMAKSKGISVMLDPSPIQRMPEELLSAIDVITPNAREAGRIVGYPVHDQRQADRAAHDMFDLGIAKNVIVKLGHKGAYWTNGTEGEYRAVYEVDVVDKVGAGDAFSGGVAAALVESQTFADAIRWGMAAGALATTRPGAQEAMPTREDVMALVNKYREQAEPA